MAFFCQQLSLLAKKYRFRAQNSVFWVRVVCWCPRYPILRVLDSREDVLHTIEAISQLFQGRQHQKRTIFCPEMAQKIPIFCPNQFFLSSGGQFKEPHPISQVLNSKTNMLQGMGPGNQCSSLPPQNGHVLPKKGLKCQFLAKTSVFWALVASSRPPNLFCRCLTQQRMCCWV